MEAYQIEIDRAWATLLNELRKDVTLTTAIGKIRGGYGEALANTIQDKIAEVLLNE